MTFNSSLVQDGNTATITLSGELDAAAAPAFKADVEQAASGQLERLVLMMQDLEYMSSAGLRALIFAKQKMGNKVDLYVVGAHPSVIETLELTGFQHSVHIVDSYDPTQ